VKRIVSDLAVIDITSDGFVLVERAPGVAVEEIAAKTAGKLNIRGPVPEMQLH
jgi:3-oxoacid CoA-transferase subunit B